MASITLTGLSKWFEYRDHRVHAVNDVTLEIPDGKILTLLGPSGCGKSTILRCIAGLERPDGGEIRFGQRVVFSHERGIFLQPEHRNIGMVFQSYAIWPHMTVFQNVAYPLQARRVPYREIRPRVERALELVGLVNLGSRPAPLLSGGQQQRVALARALVCEPEVLLLDEPLSNLDAKVRERVREEIRVLQRQLNLTTIYVTHDQIEALSLSDIMVVMSEGRPLEVGPPQSLYEQPRSRFVSEFLGASNVLRGRVVGREGELSRLETSVGPLRVRSLRGDAQSGSSRWVAVRPEAVQMLQGPDPGGVNAIQGTVVSALFEGSYTKYKLDLHGVGIIAHGPHGYSPGDQVVVVLDPGDLVVLAESPQLEAS